MSSTRNIKYPNNRNAVSERQVDLYNNLTCNQPSVFPSESLPIPQRSYRDSGPRTSVSRGGLRLSWRSIAAELMGSNLKADFREGGSQAAIFRYTNNLPFYNFRFVRPWGRDNCILLDSQSFMPFIIE